MIRKPYNCLQCKWGSKHSLSPLIWCNHPSNTEETSYYKLRARDCEKSEWSEEMLIQFPLTAKLKGGE